MVVGPHVCGGSRGPCQVSELVSARILD
jgi:hypothetical protein